MNVKEIIRQIERCDFECEAGKIKDFDPFIELKKIANNQDSQAMCCLGTETNCPLNVNNGFCRGQECQYRVLEVID